MHIGVDISPLAYNRGVSRYTRNLCQALAKEQETTLSLFGSSLRQRDQLKSSSAFINYKQRTILPIPPQLLQTIWHYGLLPVGRFLKDIDVFHSWDWMQPPDTNIPIVSTIHDLAILKFPQTAHPKVVRAHHASWQSLKQKQSHLIAVSRATKKDIIELLDYPAYMITVVPEALPVEFRQVADSLTAEQETEHIAKLKLDKPYIFFVGTREPRKNLTRLITAWQPLAKDFDLLIAGEKGWDTSQETSNKLTHHPRFLGSVTDRELCVLYANAQVFAYPSLYEGFGLPILESFHFGTPVVAANNSSMVEVGGNACEFVDPESVESITQGITAILSESLENQQKRLQRMIIRQQMFSWRSVAKETIQVYKKAIADHET